MNDEQTPHPGSEPNARLSGPELEQAVETEDLERAAQLTGRIGRDIHDLPATFPLFKNHAHDLPFELIRDTVRRCLIRGFEGTEGYNEILISSLLSALFVNSPDAAQGFVLDLAKDDAEHEFLVECTSMAIINMFDGEPEALLSAKDTLALLKGLDPAEERAREALQVRQRDYSLKIYWAVDSADFDKARALAFNPEKLKLLSVEGVEGILQNYTIEGPIEKGDFDRAWAAIEFYLDLIDYKDRHPDPVGSAASLKLDNDSRAHLAATSLWAACRGDAARPEVHSRLVALAQSLLDDERFAAPIAYALAAFYACRGYKDAMLKHLEKAINGKYRRIRASDIEFSPYLEDSDFLALMGPFIDEDG